MDCRLYPPVAGATRTLASRIERASRVAVAAAGGIGSLGSPRVETIAMKIDFSAVIKDLDG
jgi:hypothetical protein